MSDMIPLSSESGRSNGQRSGSEEQQQTLFSDKVIEHGMRPKHLARLDLADACGSVRGWCGEVMEFYLRLNKTTIERASHWADGCISTMACGDMLVEMVQGLLLADAAAITAEDVRAALGGLPYASVHCSELAVSALEEALNDAERVQGTDR